jgi:6-phosphogluconolactonase (cycloisomerase 2 family)
VYAGNRLHDSIGIFAIGNDGTLSPVTDEWTHGNYPRSFAIEPSGAFLYCCNQRADHITVFRTDAKSGKLSFTGQFTPVGNPSMIVFREM